MIRAVKVVNLEGYASSFYLTRMVCMTEKVTYGLSQLNG